jgi:hypothetical protein
VNAVHALSFLMVVVTAASAAVWCIRRRVAGSSDGPQDDPIGTGAGGIAAAGALVLLLAATTSLEAGTLFLPWACAVLSLVVVAAVRRRSRSRVRGHRGWLLAMGLLALLYLGVHVAALELYRRDPLWLTDAVCYACRDEAERRYYHVDKAIVQRIVGESVLRAGLTWPMEMAHWLSIVEDPILFDRVSTCWDGRGGDACRAACCARADRLREARPVAPPPR